MQDSIANNVMWKQIDSAAYIYLKEISEPRDNAITIILEEAVLDGVKEEVAVSPIRPTPECRVFTLSWKYYIAYCVTEEMVGSCGRYEDEEYSGRLLRIYSKSHFLDFIAKDTGAHSEPYLHYKIACLNHIIDVAAASAPELNICSRKEAGFDN